MAARTIKGSDPSTTLMLMTMQTYYMLTSTGIRDYSGLNCCAVAAEIDWYEHVQASSW